MRGRKPLLAAACTAALLIPISACSSHSAPSANSPLADSTRANALSAMHGEALAHAKYLAYATQAQQAGRVQRRRSSPTPRRPSTPIILREKLT